MVAAKLWLAVEVVRGGGEIMAGCGWSWGGGDKVMAGHGWSWVVVDGRTM